MNRGFVFFFKQKTAYEIYQCDWSSDVCSSDLRSLEDRLVKNAAVLSEAERQRKETEIRAAKRDLRRAQDEFREDLNLRRSQELSALQQKVTEVIQILAKAEKYDLIVSDGVIFAGKRVDITDKILEQLRADVKSTSQ